MFPNPLYHPMSRMKLNYVPAEPNNHIFKEGLRLLSSPADHDIQLPHIDSTQRKCAISRYGMMFSPGEDASRGIRHTGPDRCARCEDCLLLGREDGLGEGSSVGSEGEGGVVPDLPRRAVGGRIERRPSCARDPDYPVGLHTGGDGPFHLAVVEDVDVVVDHDDTLHRWVPGERGHDSVHAVPLAVLGYGDDTVQPAAAAFCETDVPDLGDGLTYGAEDHGLPRDAHEQEVLVASGKEELEDRVLLGPNPLDLDDWLLPDLVVGPGDVHEGTLGRGFGCDPSLDHILAVGGDGEAVGAFGDFQGSSVSLEVHG